MAAVSRPSAPSTGPQEPTTRLTSPGPRPGADSVWQRIYLAKTPAEIQAFYDEWAAHYDTDTSDPSQDYVGPQTAVSTLLAAARTVPGRILDAGCGTGLAGVALAKVGAKDVDGLDFSRGMLDVARKTGAYKVLEEADLSLPVKRATGSYDAVTCVGTLTKAHVGPRPALEEFVRVVKKGGVVVATVLDLIWESEGYRAEVERLGRDGGVDVLGTELLDYRRTEGLKARYVVLRKK
ncbi:hypothetical protein B9Z65_9100 [Elsinoe australis]|uniref:Methyltransferase domain-containing protein n=1 Tax=Elsinoe australis TaxID=40998 RepID=A0A2P8ABS5_9PEZI|nr:hypothetical protein B9Z65_9100 [Elsinoe australis]